MYPPNATPPQRPNRYKTTTTQTASAPLAAAVTNTVTQYIGRCPCGSKSTDIPIPGCTASAWPKSFGALQLSEGHVDSNRHSAIRTKSDTFNPALTQMSRFLRSASLLTGSTYLVSPIDMRNSEEASSTAQERASSNKSRVIHQLVVLLLIPGGEPSKHNLGENVYDVPKREYQNVQHYKAKVCLVVSCL